MKDGITIDILVEFEAVFDEPPKSLKEYLTGISRSTLLNVAAFFLGFSNHSSKYGKYEDFLSMFFCKENQLIANQIFRKLQILEQRNQAKLLITNPITILELFEFVFENLDEQETQSSPEIEVNVFKSLLLINQHLVLAQSPSGTSTKDVPEYLRVAALSLSQSYPYTDLVNYDASEVLAAQMVKSIFLFEFLAENKKTASLLSQLLEYFECPDWKYFLKSLLPLSIAVLNSKREAHIDIAINKNEDFEKGCIFLEKLMVTDSEVLKDFDYIKLRSKPFYKIKNGVYRIINGLFVIELLYKGIYFKLFEINNNQQENDKIKNIRSFYCDEFSEKYLFYKLLNSIYQNKYIEFSGEDLKKFKIDGEPDYYIRNGNNLFLFESKDILINASIKSSYDFKQYEPEFEKKLYFEIKDGKKK
ncbi:MAG: hypothetical protein IPP81_20110 [Chitinophagaceae bacterium]|nr:hypothetical protein [Chitinophagaceae bacterium]